MSPRYLVKRRTRASDRSDIASLKDGFKKPLVRVQFSSVIIC